MEGHHKVVIDTNLLVRYLTEDDPKKAESVGNLLKSAENGTFRILIPSIVIAELIWVLESSYRLKSNEIADLVDAIINTPGVDVTDKKNIISAIQLYRISNIDFIDAWIIEFARIQRAQTIYTFDKKHFKNVGDLTIKSPLP